MAKKTYSVFMVFNPGRAETRTAQTKGQVRKLLNWRSGCGLGIDDIVVTEEQHGRRLSQKELDSMKEVI